ncbi:MAG TPA: peptidoglycan DD-metalloendopeptidase family protein [Candidatus Binatia bacterium]|nr:peptidoglycan DD-metalloendopeptidase family protein [Candidatus Binatia bacterium]
MRFALLALLALLAAPTAALGEDGTAPSEPPEPRVMEPGAASGYRLPFDAGMEVPIAQGWYTTYSHNGRSGYAYDFGLYRWTPVRAAASGVVAFTHEGERACGGPELMNQANYVTIDHPDGSATLYAHLATVDVEVGDVVSAGQVIGRSGDTGYTSCLPHLHFARQYQGAGVTRSIPVYFQGYENAVFHSGQVVTSKPGCQKAHAAAAEEDAATTGFCATYFAGAFAGPALFSRPEAAIDVDLGEKAIGGYWLDEPGPYSARWVGQFSFAPWWYMFRVEGTGAVRLKIDGVTMLEDWTDAERRRAVDVRLRMWPGVHLVEVEHVGTAENDRLQVDWSPLLIDR